MTDLEIIDNSIKALGAINVPVSLLETIGAPIYQVRRNLKLLYDAVSKQAEPKEDEPIEPAERAESEETLE